MTVVPLGTEFDKKYIAKLSKGTFCYEQSKTSLLSSIVGII